MALARGGRQTRTILLDAALEAVGRLGLGKLSMGEVARAAGVSRQTLYRYFRDRDELIAALVLREEEAFVGAMVSAAAPHEDIRDALEAGIAGILDFARRHPLLDPLIESEPGVLLPFLTTKRGPALGALRSAVEGLVGDRCGHLSVTRVRTFSDALARLLLSYVTTPPDEPVPVLARQLAAMCAPGLDRQP